MPCILAYYTDDDMLKIETRLCSTNVSVAVSLTVLLPWHDLSVSWSHVVAFPLCRIQCLAVTWNSPFVALREGFSSACPDREVRKRLRLLTASRDTGSVCLWLVLIERQKQLKWRPYRFQAVYQLQQRDTAARIQDYHWFWSFCGSRSSCVGVRVGF
jgi:hypothetical protein